MSRILHFADLHLDTSFGQIACPGGLPDARPRQCLRDCLHRIVDLALQHQADLVTIGGDLYEHERRSADTGNFIAGQLGRLGTIPVLVAPGNHDPYTADSLYQGVRWPSNVYVFGAAELERVDVAGDLAVWGAAFINRFRRDCPLDGFAGVVPDGRTHLLLLHAAIGDPPSDYAPLPALAARDAGFDLALLGHIHDCRYSRPDCRLYYPGSPEPLDFSETGEHHVLLVDADSGDIRVQYLPVNRMRFGSLDVDVEGATSRDAIGRAVLSMAEEAGLSGGNVRVCLRGMPDRDVDLDMAALRAVLEPHFAFVDLSDETEPPYDFEGEAVGLTTKARFVQQLRAAIERETNDEGRQVLREALVLGLRAFEGKPLTARQRLPALAAGREDRR